MIILPIHCIPVTNLQSLFVITMINFVPDI